MADPPLTALCLICHLHPPLYTCPRCHLRTCSLSCIRTHKRRAACSGLRDPTLYKPMRDLATPAGIDHDYNFLSAIERGVERSDRVVVEGGLVGGEEVRGGRGFGVVGRGRGGVRRGEEWGRGEADKKIARRIDEVGVRVHRLPMGMARRKMNGTSWNKKRGCVAWQVEWVVHTATVGCPSISPTSTSPSISTAEGGGQEGLSGGLGKVLAPTPLGEAWSAFVEEKRRAGMSVEEKTREKKRRAGEVAEEVRKRGRVEDTLVQDTTTSFTITTTTITTALSPQPESSAQPEENYKFYLHRPLTPSNGPIFLIPLNGEEGLETQLSGKTVLEFPRVYVFPAGVEVGEGFCVEGDVEEEGSEGESEEEGDEEGEESETSSSGSSLGSEGDDGSEDIGLEGESGADNGSEDESESQGGTET